MNTRASAAVIPGNATVKEGMLQLDRSASRILLPVETNQLLIGTVTDGDIRRYLLRGGDLRRPIADIANRKPKVAHPGYAPADVKALMLKHRIDEVPVLDEAGRVVDLLLWEEVFSGETRTRGRIDVPVVIMAGGKGTRMDPVTKILPKPLIPVEDRPVIQHIMDRFAAHGARRFILTVNYKAKMIRAYFDGDETPNPYRVEFVQESDATGTAGSLALLPKSVKGDFFLSNCDILIEADYSDVLQSHRDHGNTMTVVASMQHLRVPYGVVELDGGGALKTILEKPEYDLLANTGLYVISASIRKMFPKKHAFDMTELMARVRSLGGRVGVYPVSQAAWIDIGQWPDFLRNAGRLTPGSGGPK